MVAAVVADSAPAHEAPAPTTVPPAVAVVTTPAVAHPTPDPASPPTNPPSLPQVAVTPPPVAPPVQATGEYQALVDEARELQRKGKDAKAAVVLEQAVAANASGDEALSMLARAYLNQDQSRKAYDFANRAIALNAKSAEAYLVKGTAAQALKKNGEAKAAFQTFLKLSPKSPDASDIRAILPTL